MLLPSNRSTSRVALVASLLAALASTRIAEPWDIALVVSAAVLAASALVSGLAARTA
jgi:hypothetical protein